MKPTRSQFYFLGGVFFWVSVLQGVMFWYLSASLPSICNGAGAWPFSQLPFLGGSIVTLVLTVGIALWAWHTLKIEGEVSKRTACQPFFWALIVGSGLSHAVERLSSQCVLDYWQIPFFDNTVHFNLGDVSLTVGVLFFILYWLWEYKQRL